MAGADKSLRVKKIAVDVIHISGYTRPHTQELLAAGAEWDGKLLVWVYKGATLPAKIQNIIIGQFALNPETPMDAIIDEPNTVGESDGVTTVVSFGDVMEHWNKRARKWDDPKKYVYIGRPNAQYGLPRSTWANPYPMNNDSDAERQRVIAAYREHLLKLDRAALLKGLDYLRGKTLVCWCKRGGAEVACHGDVLVEFINNPPPVEVEPKPSAPVEPSKSKLEKHETKEGTKLRALADAMQKDIDDKNRPYPFESQPATNKRVNEYQSRKKDARHLIFIQDKLRALADLWDAGTISPAMQGYKTRKAVDELLFSLHGNAEHKAELLTIGTKGISDPTPADRLEEKRLEIALREYQDYFPTSMKWLQNNMIEAADIQRGDVILEPSAGTGHLAQAIREVYPENELRVIEWANDLRAILEMLNFNLIGDDFLEYTEQVDVIIQNPPFTGMADIDHVYHAWKCLKAGGRLVSIMSASPFFNSTKKAEMFRNWFNEHGGYMQKLPDKAFMQSERSTGAATVMIVMRKPKEAADEPESDSNRLTSISIAAEPKVLMGVGTMPVFDEAPKNPTSAICAGCGKSALYTVERNGKRYCEECLPLPGALPKQDAAWLKTGTPAAEGDVSFVQPVSGEQVLSVEETARILYGFRADPKPLAYEDYLRIKADYPDDIVLLHVGAMWATWDDDVDNLELALTVGCRDKKQKFTAITGTDTHKRKMATFNMTFTEQLEEAVCEGARMTLVFVDKEGTIRVRESKPEAPSMNEVYQQLYPEVMSAWVSGATSEQILDAGIERITSFVDAKKAETTVEIASETSQNEFSTSDSVDDSQVQENAKNDAIRVLETFSKGSLVEHKSGIRGYAVSSDAAFVYVRTPAQLDDYKRHDEKWEIAETKRVGPVVIIDMILEQEQQIADSMTKILGMLRKPVPESAIPFIALYISGAENVELLFNHYVRIIRADDPQMTPTQMKVQAAAVLLYQYQQEWVTVDVEKKYPAIFEAFKAAAKGEILISMLMRISGISGITELTYDDDLMTRLVDLVSYVPF